MSYASPRRAVAEQKYQEKRRRHARIRRGALLSTAGALLLVAVLAVTADRILWPGGFPVTEVYLEGEFNHISPQTLRSEVVAALDGNFFSLDLARLEAAAESLPWVYQATVRRIWPRGIRVVIEEQRPVARWGQDAWLNSDGEIVRLGKVAGSEMFPDLSGPETSAVDVLARYREWRTRLYKAGLQLRAVNMSERHAWRIRVHDPDADSTFDLLLGRRDLAGRLQRFEQFYRQLSTQQKPALQRVDARYPNGVATVGLPPASEPPVAEQGDKA